MLNRKRNFNDKRVAIILTMFRIKTTFRYEIFARVNTIKSPSFDVLYGQETY
jgi:hypothetical protein